MKRLALIIPTVAILFSCSTIDYTPKYADFDNAWESENLIGEVKVLKQFKSNVLDYETERTDEPRIEFKKEFTDFGKIVFHERYDGLGKKSNYLKNQYNEDGKLTIAESENFQLPSSSIEKIKYDLESGDKISSNLVINDSMKLNVYFKYNKSGEVIEQVMIFNNDTSYRSFIYEYNNEGEIISKIQIDKNKSDVDEFVDLFTYDSLGNLTEVISKSPFVGEMKSQKEYDSKNRITKITSYKAGFIEKETYYDEFFNQTFVLFYSEGTLTNELSYKYEFDKTGNWIKRESYMKLYRGEEKNFLTQITTREIEYYN